MHDRTPPPRGSQILTWYEGIRAFMLAFPGAWEDHPWGETVAKVKKKVFVFLTATPERLAFSVKLPASGREALLLPNTEPTGYGLGKSGWVSARFEEGDALPMPLVRRWIEESYRAVAPKTLVAELDAGGPPVPLEASVPGKPARRKKP